MTSPHVEEARHILSRGIRDSMKLTPPPAGRSSPPSRGAVDRRARAHGHRLPCTGRRLSAEPTASAFRAAAVIALQAFERIAREDRVTDQAAAAADERPDPEPARPPT